MCLNPVLKLKLIKAFKTDILSHKKTFRRFACETLGVEEYERLFANVDYIDAYDAMQCILK